MEIVDLPTYTTEHTRSPEEGPMVLPQDTVQQHSNRE